MFFFDWLFGRPPNITELKNTRNVSGLIKALRYTKDWTVRRDSANALAEIGDATAVESLCNTLYDSEKDVRYAAASALVKIDLPNSVRFLVESLRDTLARDAATRALLQAGRAATVYLTGLLTDENKTLRINVIELLGQIGDPNAIAPLASVCANDPKTDVRLSAVRAIGRIGGKDAIEPLAMSCARDSEAAVRAMAAEVLGQSGSLRALKPLILARANDPETTVRTSAAGALEKLLNRQPSPIRLAVRAITALPRFGTNLVMGTLHVMSVMAAVLIVLVFMFLQIVVTLIVGVVRPISAFILAIVRSLPVTMRVVPLVILRIVLGALLGTFLGGMLILPVILADPSFPNIHHVPLLFVAPMIIGTIIGAIIGVAFGARGAIYVILGPTSTLKRYF